jgi:hypothetical protein
MRMVRPSYTMLCLPGRQVHWRKAMGYYRHLIGMGKQL